MGCISTGDFTGATVCDLMLLCIQWNSCPGLSHLWRAAVHLDNLEGPAVGYAGHCGWFHCMFAV